MQSFSASHVEHRRIRRRNGNVANGTGRLIIKYRIPGTAVIVRFPDASVVYAHVKYIWLLRHSYGANCPACAERPNATPFQTFKIVVGYRLGGKSGGEKKNHPLFHMSSYGIVWRGREETSVNLPNRKLNRKHRIWSCEKEEAGPPKWPRFVPVLLVRL